MAENLDFSALSHDDRVRLLRFVCSFAWADLTIEEEEREFIADLVLQLGLDAEERQLVEVWLTVPPRAEEVDPGDVPYEHRQLFLETAKRVIQADGVVDPAEVEALSLFRALLQSTPRIEN